MNDETPSKVRERRRGYKELQEQLDQHVEDIHMRLQRFILKALIAFTVLGLTSAGSLLGFGIVLKREGQNARAIQQQRYDTLMRNCLEQNDRHNRAQTRADALFPDKSTRTVVRVLINELQPFVGDCQGYVELRVKGIE